MTSPGMLTELEGAQKSKHWAQNLTSTADPNALASRGSRPLRRYLC
ncbi:MAG: hypothetical protein QNL84_06985 [Acidimicrobiia bacterium]